MKLSSKTILQKKSSINEWLLRAGKKDDARPTWIRKTFDYRHQKRTKKNGKKSICASCGANKSRFVSSSVTGGRGVAFPGELIKTYRRAPRTGKGTVITKTTIRTIKKTKGDKKKKKDVETQTKSKKKKEAETQTKNKKKKVKSTKVQTSGPEYGKQGSGKKKKDGGGVRHPQGDRQASMAKKRVHFA